MSKIVVIEEDDAMRMLFSEWLNAEGYEIQSATQADDACVGQADLVILDLPNPRSRVQEAVRVVRAVRDAWPHALVIGISAQLVKSLSDKSDTARAYGVDRLLAKPCTRVELVTAVGAALSR